MRKYSICILATAALVGTSCERPVPGRYASERLVLGTKARITAHAANPATARTAVQAAYGRIDDVNRLMSDYIDDSEVGHLNALNAGESLVVSPETFHCIRRAIEIGQQSGGAFDITCRPLVQLWKEAGQTNTLPTPDELKTTLAQVGIDKLQLNPSTRSVTLAIDELQIDLGGIAKGYALDLAAEALRKAGATHGLVDIGGDVLAVGPQPNGDAWRIGVQDPFRPGANYVCILGLRDCATATSGVQQRFTVIEGARYSHIIDPRTGAPAQQAPMVTVIAPDGLTADAWATAFSVLSVEEGLELHDRLDLPDVDVLWLWGTKEDVQMRHTDGFESYVIEWTLPRG